MHSDGALVSPAAGEFKHAVQLYEDSEQLCTAVADFLATAAARGEPMLVIATDPHRRAILDALDAHAEMAVWLDAADVLEQLRDGTGLSRAAFDRVVGAALDTASMKSACLTAGDAARVQVFGEVVQLLVAEGSFDAAHELEGFWNDLARTRRFDLLCGYDLASFGPGTPSDCFKRVCSTHNELTYSTSVLEREVTRRIERERALELTQRDLTDVLENAAEGIHCVGADGTILWANRAELELLGYERTEYVGRNITEFHADPPVIEDLLARLTAGQEVRDYEARLLARDGTIREVSITSNVLFVDGEFIHTRCFTRDIGARKATERALESANRMKDEFMAVLGHELRNPLAPILSALNLMELRYGDVGAMERGVIERQVRHLTRLVDDLLDVSRIARGKVQLERAPVEVSWLIERSLELAGPALTERNHTLRTSVASGDLRVDGDEQRLSQVLTNVLNNAARFTPPGGTITLQACRERGEVVLRVTDNGSGIDPELMPRLFEPFAQHPQGMDRARGGLGLGLSIVRSLVDLHGGTVALWSAGRGCGTEVEIRLPALLTELRRIRPLHREERTPGLTKRRILVVDDNRDAADLLTELLRAAGHDARTAFDGPSALSMAEVLRPEVAFVDIGLPGMNGYEVARRLRRLPALADMHLVALTGYGHDAARAMSGDAGFDEHLVKPVTHARIADALARASSHD